jgi:acetyltransferase-like isoleucine patch superfamily enzyme
MSPFVAKLVAKLRKESPGTVARKVVSNAGALLCGQLFLGACDRVGARARCFGRPRIDNQGRIRVGDDFGMGCSFGVPSLTTLPGGAIDIGDGVTINYGTSVCATRAVRIGDRVLVGPYCVIEDADVAGETLDAAPIEIGDDVWLAARVVVRPGARIGAGAVIAAGSVVEGEIPPHAVASGAPARVLRIRDEGTHTPPVSGIHEVAEPSMEVLRAARA